MKITFCAITCVILLLYLQGCYKNENTKNSDTVYPNNSIIRGNNTSFEKQITCEDIENIFKINKVELMNKYGNNYSIVPAGVELSEDGYSFDDIGVTIIFEDMKINCVYLNIGTFLDGVANDFSIDEIQKKWGNEKVKTTIFETEDNAMYYVEYFKNELKYTYISSDFDGKDGWWMIDYKGV